MDMKTLKWLLADRQITEERLSAIFDSYDAWVEVKFEKETDAGQIAQEESEEAKKLLVEDKDLKKLEKLLDEYHTQISEAQKVQRNVCEQLELLAVAMTTGTGNRLPPPPGAPFDSERPWQ
jgi:hypothetical protein